MADGIAVVDEQIEHLKLSTDLWSGCLEVFNKAEPESGEVVAEYGPSWVVGVEAATLADQQVKRLFLPFCRGVNVDPRRLIMEISAESLELRHQSEEEAPVELCRAPLPSSTGADEVRVYALQFSQPSDS